MCMPKTPDVPTVPERQAARLPDSGASEDAGRARDKWRKAIMAGIVTSPQGVLGSPMVGKPSLG